MTYYLFNIDKHFVLIELVYSRDIWSLSDSASSKSHSIYSIQFLANDLAIHKNSIRHATNIL